MYALKDEAITVKRKRIARLMRAMELYAKGVRRADKNYNVAAGLKNHEKSFAMTL